MSLNVIGLISGGKDSLYSLAHCIKNGHNVVAVANLFPHADEGIADDGEGQDLDSFMYQTVGHTIIPVYAKALGLPLFRRAITGTACQRGRYYDTSISGTQPDETEDMYLLIQDVLKHHPEANALNAGAILSTYQRTRVESVAARLGLISLAYLWQYPALPPPGSRYDSLTGLLDDMGTAQCDARIIKIASGGVHNTLISENVAAPMTGARLVSGLAPFFVDDGQEFPLRGAVLGEGGEYETLALDGPIPLWKKRIEVAFEESFEAEGGTTYTTFGKVITVDKDNLASAELPLPSLLDKRFVAVKSQLQPISLRPGTPKNENLSTRSSKGGVTSSSHVSSNSLQLSNIACSNAVLDPSQQLEHVIDAIAATLKDHCHKFGLSERTLTFGNIASTTLLLRSISDFAAINQVYATRLWPQGLPNPPSRVTIAAPLPEGTTVSLSLIIDLNDAHAECKKGLHVQSRSYWAPANIGPYSQAISTTVLLPQNIATPSQDRIERAVIRTPIDVVHMAGQIPLTPASMAMLDRPFVEQAVLALQHLWRVGQERGVYLWAGAGVAYLADTETHAVGKTSGGFTLDKVREAARIWILSHWVDEKGVVHKSCATSDNTEAEVGAINEEDEDIDIWDLQQQSRGFGGAAAANLTVGDHLHHLPKRDLFRTTGKIIHHSVLKSARSDNPAMPLFIAAEVSGLPRNAPVEWWSTGIAGLGTRTSEQQCRVWPINQNIGDAALLSGIAIEHLGQDSAEVVDDLLRDRSSFSLFVTLTIKMDLEHTGKDVQPPTVDDLKTVLFGDGSNMTCQIVTAHSFLNLSCAPDTRALLEQTQLVQQATVVPCHHVWASRTTHGDYLTCIQNGDAVEEVASAVILRIDAYLQ